MGPCSRHTAQEGDVFGLLEINILWCEKGKSIPEQQHRTLWGNRYKTIYIHSKTLLSKEEVTAPKPP
jgi:hypothetical protein